MNVNSVESHTIKAMIVNTLAEKVNNQKVEVPVSNQLVAMSSKVLDLANNTYSVEGHLQKWCCAAR